MQTKKRNTLLLIIILTALWFCAANVHAAGSKWVCSGGHYYYVTSKGRRLTGLQKISSRHYYFDSNAIQRTGWRKIGSNYYYFRIYGGKKGYMLKGKTVDGIQLLSDGRAVVTARAAKKLPVMVRAQSIVDSITKETMKKSTKRKTCFDYICKKCADIPPGDHFNGNSNWDTDYASLLFSRWSGDCFSFSCATAYLFHACGIQNVELCSTGIHCWIELKGLAYDPHWTNYGGANVYAMPASLNGVGKRPYLIGTALYRRNLDKV